MSGFIKIHRKITKWEWYSNKNCRLVFLHLIITVNHEAKMWRGQKIDRGQILTSPKNLALETGLSYQEIRTVLNNLQKSNEITIKATNKNTLITLVNYGVYQDQQRADQRANQHVNNEQKRKELTTTKEEKKKEEKNNIKDTTSVVSKSPHLSENDLEVDSLKNEEVEKEKVPRKRKVFKPPEITEVIDHMESKGEFQAETEANKFWNHYDAKGWMIGKNKMQNWKSAASGWLNRKKEYNAEKRTKEIGSQRANGTGAGGGISLAEALQTDAG